MPSACATSTSYKSPRDRFDRIFILSNVHAEHAATIDFLRVHRIIDAELKWSFGFNALVILGETVDQGPTPVALLWFLYQLQAEAAAAGGAVELVLGNAELLLLRGETQGLHPSSATVAANLGVSAYAHFFRKKTVLVAGSGTALLFCAGMIISSFTASSPPR